MKKIIFRPNGGITKSKIWEALTKNVIFHFDYFLIGYLPKNLNILAILAKVNICINFCPKVICAVVFKRTKNPIIQTGLYISPRSFSSGLAGCIYQGAWLQLGYQYFIEDRRCALLSHYVQIFNISCQLDQTKINQQLKQKDPLYLKATILFQQKKIVYYWRKKNFKKLYYKVLNKMSQLGR